MTSSKIRGFQTPSGIILKSFWESINLNRKWLFLAGGIRYLLAAWFWHAKAQVAEIYKE